MILATVAPQNVLKFNFSSLADPENWLHGVYYDVFQLALHYWRVPNGPKFSNALLKKFVNFFSCFEWSKYEWFSLTLKWMYDPNIEELATRECMGRVYASLASHWQRSKCTYTGGCSYYNIFGATSLPKCTRNATRALRRAILRVPAEFGIFFQTLKFQQNRI